MHSECGCFERLTETASSIWCVAKVVGRSRARAEVSNALYKVELIRRRASWVRYWRNSLGLHLRLAEWRWSNFRLIRLQLSGAGYSVLMGFPAKPERSTLSSRRGAYLFTDLANPLNDTRGARS
jgi:hypothetical protein